MGRFGNLFAWLGSQPPLFLLLIGVALFSSAVGLVLLLQSVCDGLRKACPHDSRRAAGRPLRTPLAKALGRLATAGWVRSPRAR